MMNRSYDILLMERLLHQLIGSSPHDFQGFIHTNGGCFGKFIPSTVPSPKKKIDLMSHFLLKLPNLRPNLLGFVFA